MMLKLTNQIQDVNRIATRLAIGAALVLGLCMSPGIVLAGSGPAKVFRALYEEVCIEAPTMRADAEFEKDQRAWIATHREEITPRAIEIAKGQHADIIWMRVLPLVSILQSQELEAVLLERCRNTQEPQEQSWIVGTLGKAGYRPARDLIEEIVLVPNQNYSLWNSGVFALGKIGDANSARILEQLDARLRAGKDDANTEIARLEIRRAIDRIRGTVRVVKTKRDQSTPKAAAKALIQAVQEKDWDAFLELVPELMQITLKYDVRVKEKIFRDVFENQDWRLVLQELEENLNSTTIQNLDRPTAAGGTTILKIDGEHSIELIKEDGVWKIVTFR